MNRRRRVSTRLGFGQGRKVDKKSRAGDGGGGRGGGILSSWGSSVLASQTKRLPSCAPLRHAPHSSQRHCQSLSLLLSCRQCRLLEAWHSPTCDCKSHIPQDAERVRQRDAGGETSIGCKCNISGSVRVVGLEVLALRSNSLLFPSFHSLVT